ncbi:glycosyltransferase family 2 protein [Parasporobacterium paucivorans]|uniref:Glycosyl transferase family 2 n=1 Tax=Parasporobacterium paucivorans DSM 15970 TaxID=1122934 RepID=A0A1M6GVJ0_9FIRM|nr:glycosyltransferase family A protein [Parasporobacterium paucivorans]SHJ13956.1 Glycosyl transferase family 2 [Parasporobacterium paucivorans DSM 15970]
MESVKILSICMPTYNRNEHIMRQLKFILSEFAPYRDEVEILVSDNCSEDDTAKNLQDLRKQNKTFTYWVNKENIGFIGNTRKLAKKAKGRYIWFVGDDDIITHGIADAIFGVFYSGNDVGLIAMNHNFFMGEYTPGCSKSVINFPKGGLHKNGKKAAVDIFVRNDGVLMFITAVIMKKKYVIEAIRTCTRSLTTNLSWALAAASDKNGIWLIEEVYIHDRYSGISWSEKYLEVFAYNMTVSVKEMNRFGYSNEQIKKMLKSRKHYQEFVAYMVRSPRTGIPNYLNYLSPGLLLNTPAILFKALFKKIRRHLAGEKEAS